MNDLRLFDIPEELPDLASYDWIVVSSSAGKDSQAMLDYVCELAEAQDVLNRVVVVHCDLGRVEWKGTKDLAEEQASRYGARFITVWRKQGDLLQHIEKRGMFPSPTSRYCTAHHKQNQAQRVYTALAAETRDGDLLQQVEERGMWPDPARRYCTSDQKRAQVHRVYTALTTTSNHIATPVRILSCQGMRAEESPARAKRKPFCQDERASNGRRIVDNWLPIHRWTVERVWERIRMSRTADLVHYAYRLGMPRVSCCFCIFAPKSALLLAGYHNRELLDDYVAVEEKIGHKFRLDLPLAQVKAELDAGLIPGPVADWKMA